MNVLRHNLILILSWMVAGSAIWAGSAAGQTAVQARIKSVSVHGNERFGDGKILDWLQLKRNTATSRAQAVERGRQMLLKMQEEGYYFARIDSVALDYTGDSTRVDVRVFVTEGEQLRVGTLRITGVDSAHSEVLSALRTERGKVFSPARLEADIEQILAHFEQGGYPYCTVVVAELDLSPVPAERRTEVNLELQVDPGPAVAIDEILILGNRQTKRQVILRELPVNPGQRYDQRRIDAIRPKLLKLGYFDWVNPPRLELGEHDAGLLVIELAEGTHNRFDGVIGYNPATPNADGYVTGLLDLRFGNLFGTGRRIDAHWQRRTKETQDFRFGYTEPWVAGLPLNVTFGFEQLIQDTSYIQRQIGLDLALSVGDRLSLFSSFSSRTVSPDSVGALRFNILPSSALAFGVGLLLDTLDEPLNPSSGLRYGTGFEWSRKRTRQDETVSALPDAAFNLKRLAVDFENYFSLFRWQVVAIGLHGREVTSGERVVDITDQYRLGGASTLRGYREEQFRGSRIAWSNLEYRYLLGGNSRFFAFFDSGYFYREELQSTGAKIKIDAFNVGYGFGLRLDTRLGLLGVDYGLGQGDSFSNGKVHIGLTNEF